MGASLPVLIRAFDRADEPAAVGVGRLYAANTAGAVLGPLLSVFWFFPTVGLSATLAIGAALDFIVCFGLLLAKRRLGLGPIALEDVPDDSAVPVRRILATVGLSGASAMVYEVAWSRTLSHGLWVVGLRRLHHALDVPRRDRHRLGAHGEISEAPEREPSLPAPRQGAPALGDSRLREPHGRASRLPFLFLNFYTSFEGSEGTLFFSQFVIAALLMLPCTMALGATLPLAVDALPKPADLGRPASRGSTAPTSRARRSGPLSASVLLLASLGIEFSVRAAAVAVLLMALVLFSRAPKFSMADGAVAGSAILLILALDPSASEPRRASASTAAPAPTRGSTSPSSATLVAAHQLLFYRDGPTAVSRSADGPFSSPEDQRQDRRLERAGGLPTQLLRPPALFGRRRQEEWAWSAGEAE